MHFAMKVVETFLSRHWDGKSPLALGYSGGPDSKALLYALCELGIKPLRVAHVDHGWREESAAEAKKLQREVEELGFPFHSIRLVPEEKNKEAKAREARMRFFATLGCQAVLLAHHADDLAETVLKRILEGAHLSAAGGMESVSKWDNLMVWRPLLEIKRAEILSFLAERKLEPLWDSTNSDPAYLRTRLREEIFPFLNRSFGKETMENLVCFSKRSYELKEYLERRCAAIPVLRGPWGMALFLKRVERIEARYLLQKHLKLSRASLETILDWVASEEPNKKFNSHISVDRGAVFITDLMPDG